MIFGSGEAEQAVFRYSLTSMSRGIGFFLGSVLLLFVILPVAVVPVARADMQSSLARIVDVRSPYHIRPSEDFAVTVTVEYSAAHSADIAVTDAETGFVLASIDLFTPMPSGAKSYTLRLHGRDQPGVWELIATVRTWWQNSWYSSQNGGTFRFNIEVVRPSPSTLSIRSNVPLIVIAVDNDLHKVLQDGLYLQTEYGLHTIAAEPSLTYDNRTRVLFDHWSDGVRSSQRVVYVADRLDLSATYVTEYLLSVQSNVGETVGSGWYPAGANVTFAVMAGQPPTDETSYVFSQWSGDSNSSSLVSSLAMNGPKTVVANWSKNNSQATMRSALAVASMICLACSGVFVTTGILVRRRPRVGRHNSTPQGRIRTNALLLLFMLLVVAQSKTIQLGQASNPIQPESVTIGGATWDHWNQAGSDTLLVWLGGGIVEGSTYLVNPFEFESYNTIRFIQDLARYYDVLALRKGSVRSADAALNRTIFHEPYPSSYDFIKRIRLWAHEQGYAYLYVVGYSVGAMVAARELIVASPGNWTSSDGLIIITTQIAESVSSQAKSLQANLLLLYGDRIAPEFTASGAAFFANAPEEGWRDGHWYHKEYHVISDVEHEVWTIQDSGEYDTRAVLLILKFIETCKSLQFEGTKEEMSQAALNHTSGTKTRLPLNATIVTVRSPSRVQIGEAFRIITQMRYDLPSNSTVAVVAFDKDAKSIVSVAKKQVSGRGETYVPATILFIGNATTAHLSLIPLVQVDESWIIIVDSVKEVSVDVRDTFSMRVIVGYPNVTVEFDGQSFRTGPNGEIALNATQGEHILSLPPLIMIGNAARMIFQQWNVTSASSTLHLQVLRDVSVLAVYRKQYYLNITSLLGETSGEGWYDENATATFRVISPVVYGNTTNLFIGWSGDSNDSSPSSSLRMNSPKNVEASWNNIKSSRGSVKILRLQTLFVASLAILISSATFALIAFRRRRGPIGL